ncbi:hypothetical protein [Acidocella sp.]|uniref:hypothetical protein n=1 Tax=Acidocella sp. TaxID=50710 RepID=UPI00260A739B|nr:hypothetical protein [Acidocella sp.]
MSKGPRDYKAEYARRITRGLEQGLSRSQARGHPKPLEPAKATITKATKSVGTRKPAKAPKFDRRLEDGFRALRDGQTLTASAKSVRVSPERLRRYVAETGMAERKGNRWIIGPDVRPRIMQMFSNGEAVKITVDPDEARLVGAYHSAVGRFLNTNDPDFLGLFDGQSVTDITGKSYPFETDPNALYRLSETGSESFEDVYRIVV